MKEISIKEKAKAYDKAIERAKVFKEHLLEINDKGYADEMDYIFPELAESENERIINNIRKVIGWYRGMFTEKSLMPEQYQEIDAWLEKQGWQKPAEWSEEDETSLLRALAFIKNTSLKDVDEIKESVITWITSLKDKVQPQPKQEWSEEDEMFVHGLIRGLAAKRDIHGHTTFSSDCIDITETINWLKSLKSRVLLYPVSVEYNEDDIDNIADTFIPEPVWNALEESEGEGSNAAAYDYSQMIAMFKAGVHWLKSLKDRIQQQWKPSNEQMNGLKEAIEFLGCTKTRREQLQSLYEQLKKLRVE